MIFGIVSLGLAVSAMGRTEAAGLVGAFNGNAYATFANATAGPVAAELGRSAFQPCPCKGTNGQTLSNVVDALSAGNGGSVATAQVTQSTAFTQKTATTAEVQTTSAINGINLLQGLITADSVKAVATISATATSMTPSSSGSTFINLVVAGRHISANVAPGTVISLPGIGSVTLEKVVDTGNFDSKGQILVEMLTINVTTTNSLGLAVGSSIVVAHAVSGFSRSTSTAVFGGQAYATFANTTIGNDLQNKIGKAAFVTIPCQGTGGKTVTNNINTFDVSNLLSIGTGTSTAFGGSQGGVQVAKTSADVENLELFNGVIQAKTITAVAQETRQNGVATPSTAGSGFIDLSVASVPVPANAPPNTNLSVPLLGNIVVNEQKTSAGKVSVNGLHIFINQANALGLPVGSEIVIAHADASIAPF